MYLTAWSAHDRRKDAHGTNLNMWFATACTAPITFCTTAALQRDLRGEEGGDNSNGSDRGETMKNRAPRTNKKRTNLNTTKPQKTLAADAFCMKEAQHQRLMFCFNK